MVLEYWQK